MRFLKSNPRSTAALALCAAGLLLGSTVASAQDLASFEKRTTEHVLDNGWTFIIVERDVAPVFSFATFANVGGAQEVPGVTGIAHMFEHMAFKGSRNIGTTDYEAEAVALAEVESAYQAFQTARLSGAEAAQVEELKAAFEEKQTAAQEFVIVNEFGDILDREGGTGLNAFTNTDFTGYFYSLPANKFELFCYLESERFVAPVFREFYTERDVVQEERRMRTESQPVGRLVEQLLATAFVAHPYKQPVVGYMSDLQSITATDAEEFYKTHYTPNNMVTVIVGDIEPKRVIKLVEKYFGRIPAGPKPPMLRTVEPEQVAEKTIVLRDPAQPLYAEAYHKPAGVGVDEPVYDAIDNILSGGRTSRLYRSLVRDKQIALTAGSFSSFPGTKYPTLWIGFAVPARGITNEEVKEAMREEMERLKTEAVTDEELQRFKTQAKAGLLRSLQDNQGLANNIVQYQTLYGDWRELFRYIDRIDKVSKEDVMRVAKKTFVASNRTIGMIVTETAESMEESESLEDSEAMEGAR